MTKYKKPVLIVEDHKVNRELLKKIIQSEYPVIEAENGREALDILEAEKGNIAAIMLDIVMPIMDGFEFLKELKQTEYNNFPVIVMTGENQQETEQEALDLGAWDFVSKPYRPRVIMSRLQNAIARSQMFALNQMKHMVEHDALTDLYNRAFLFSTIRQMLYKHERHEFVFIRIDIKRFRLFNTFLGESEGDKLLKFVANIVRQNAQNFMHFAYGRIEADVFGACVTKEDDQINNFVNELVINLSDYMESFIVEPSVGIVEITDKTIPVEVLYLRASQAVKKCKDKYKEYVSYYDKNMDDDLVMEQEIINEMQSALENEQFHVYLQPKYNLEDNLPYGAEALVRWFHPTKGVISPGVFIPVFERNGFIGKLDLFMWESVCKLLRRWTDEGLNPAPISVNMSRCDIYNTKVVDVLVDLVNKYQIPPRLLNLEVTESAYMDNPMIIKETVDRLHKAGFLVMMDDFGSGYSSLNTLKDIDVDYLKVDMKFLSSDIKDLRSQIILTSILRMSSWLEMPSVVEGVETGHQCDFLKSIGCNYVQGYYFARPMPVEKYEKLIKAGQSRSKTEDNNNHQEMVNLVWSNTREVEMFMNKFPVPVAIYEFCNDKFIQLRANQMFIETFGTKKSTSGSQMLCYTRIDDENSKELTKAFEKLIEGDENAVGEISIEDNSGDKNKYKVLLRLLGNNSNASVILATYVKL